VARGRAGTIAGTAAAGAEVAKASGPPRRRAATPVPSAVPAPQMPIAPSPHTAVSARPAGAAPGVGTRRTAVPR